MLLSTLLPLDDHCNHEIFKSLIIRRQLQTHLKCEGVILHFDSTMVFRKNVKRIVAVRSKPKGSPEPQDFLLGPINKNKSRNQLLHPISPYDELPDIQDLVEKLTPLSAPTKKSIAPVSQERQHQSRSQNRSLAHQQQRDPPMPSPPFEQELYRNGAHNVPLVIEIPSIPTKQSEDSEMTVDEIFCPKNSSEDRGPRSLTPHPSFEEEIQPSASDLKYLFEAGTKAEQETWPSDEESACNTSHKKAEETMTWPDGSMFIWDLDCSNENAIEFRCSDRRMMEV